jgi:phosphopantetheinyl transferase
LGIKSRIIKGEVPGLCWIEIPQPCPGDWVDRAFSLLDDYERDRYGSFTHKEAGCMFLMGRFLAKTKLSELLSCPPESIGFKLTTRGKPYLKGGDYHFSLSHSGNWLSLMINKEKPVGVDLEVIKDRDFLKLAGRFFSPLEKKWLEEDPYNRSGRFYQIWTQKEAVLKATGEGLAGRLSQITMPCIRGEEEWESWLIKSFSPSQNITGAAAVPQ